MDMNAPNPPLLSVHILLPEAVNRRLERWTHKLEGASWPAWGGHVTLVPNFVELGGAGAARAALEALCLHEEPFLLRFGAPIAVQDSTRADYSAVFLGIEGVDSDSRSGNKSELHDTEEVVEDQHIFGLRQRILDVLEPLREDMYPQLVMQKFLPHVTLALGVSELEAEKLVREIRAEPLTAEFKVEVVWLVTQTFGEGGRFERQPIALGKIAPAEVMRD